MALQVFCNDEKAEQIKKAIAEKHPTVILNAEDSQSSHYTTLVYSTCGINELMVGLTAMQNGAGGSSKI